MTALQRIAAVLVLLLAGLSLLVSTEAYQVARPVNQTQVPIVTTEQGALKVAAGPNDQYLKMVTNSGGRLLLDMTKGPGGTNLAFGTNSVYTLRKIITVTNTTGSAKSVSVTVTGNTVATLTSVTGHIGGGAQTAQPFALPANQFVDINLTWTTAGTAGPNLGMTITVTGN